MPLIRINCRHLSDGACSLGRYGSRPSGEQCLACNQFAGRPRGLGDVVASVATPIARALGMDCIDKATGQLRPESPCAKRKEALNRAAPMPCTSCGGPADGLRRLGGG